VCLAPTLPTMMPLTVSCRRLQLHLFTIVSKNCKIKYSEYIYDLKAVITPYNPTLSGVAGLATLHPHRHRSMRVLLNMALVAKSRKITCVAYAIAMSVWHMCLLDEGGISYNFGGCRYNGAVNDFLAGGEMLAIVAEREPDPHVSFVLNHKALQSLTWSKALHDWASSRIVLHTYI
jgi:hypothetical protein